MDFRSLDRTPAIACAVCLLIAVGCDRRSAVSPDADSPEVATPAVYAVLTAPPTEVLERLDDVYHIRAADWAERASALCRTRIPFIRHALEELLTRERQLVTKPKIEMHGSSSPFANLPAWRPPVPTPDQREHIRRLINGWDDGMIDGRRVVELLELAAYADVTCHSIEYPLRVSTLEFVRLHADREDVRRSLEWTRDSYRCKIDGDDGVRDPSTWRPDDELLAQSMEIRMSEYARELLHEPSG